MATKLKTCDNCKGTGQVYEYWRKKYADCIKCEGSGFVLAAPKESWRSQRKRLQGN